MSIPKINLMCIEFINYFQKEINKTEDYQDFLVFCDAFLDFCKSLRKNKKTFYANIYFILYRRFFYKYIKRNDKSRINYFYKNFINSHEEFLNLVNNELNFVKETLKNGENV